MTKQIKIMQLNKPASFRPPNTKFVLMFNAAMTATGFSINDLCVRALAVGLPKVVPQLIAEKQKEEQSRKAAEAQFLKFIDENAGLSDAKLHPDNDDDKVNSKSGQRPKAPSRN